MINLDHEYRKICYMIYICGIKVQYIKIIAQVEIKLL